MNIVIVPSWYRNKAQPNSGSFFREQAKALANNGHNVVVLDASLRVRKGWFKNDCMKHMKMNDENITVYSYNFPSLFFGRFPKLYAFIFRLVLKSIINKMLNDGFKPDIYHAHSVYAAGYTLATLEGINSPIIITEHSSAFNNNIINKHLKVMLERAITKSSVLISVSESLASNIKLNLNSDFLSNKVVTIPNMVDDRFQYQEPIINKEFVFLSIGNLVKNKQMELLITSFHAAFKQNKSVKLKIVGVGFLHDNIQKLIKKLNLSDQVFLMGEMNKQKLLDEYISCHAFVLLSKKETFGLVYREAMAVGRPIISTLNGGIEDDAYDYNGIFVKGDEEVEITKALKGIYFDYDQYDKLMISQKCRAKYSSRNIVDEVQKIYYNSQIEFLKEKQIGEKST